MAGTLGIPAVLRAGPIKKRPNILFLSLDDLNDWISPLSSSEGMRSGYPGVVTPNLRRLADRGANFTSAYAPVPACSPSRASVLLGASADKTGVYYNGQDWDQNAIPHASSIFGYMRDIGAGNTRSWKVISQIHATV